MSSTFENAFVRPNEEYKRDINILAHYVNDAATYLSIQTGKAVEVCRKFVIDNLKPNGQFPFKDPKVNYLFKAENGDRVKGETTLSAYLKDSIQKRELIAPTLTTYFHPDDKPSLLADYVDENVAMRSKAKKAMFAADAAGDDLLAAVKKIEQSNRKTSNNSISGAHVTPSTPLFNKTAHSTLTSTCRSTSGYGNANNEKFLSGNRHYFNHHIVLNNIISIVNHTDYQAVKMVMDKYNLHYPTAAEVIEAIRYSTHLYWREEHYFAKIIKLVEKLNPLQLAAFLYTSDFHHLAAYNEAVARTFIQRLSKKVEGACPDAVKVIKASPEDHRNLAHQICADIMRGRGQRYDVGQTEEELGTLACTCMNIGQTITDYADLIKAFWVTPNLPASMAHFPESIRRSALTSDTDSTIFTVQDWVFWYKGGLSFDDEAMSVAATMIFLASATITHVLAIMSANFGIILPRLNQIAMKNEYKFDVFTPTQAGKHYYANKSCQEGNVFPKHKMEIKGVGLKSSNAPRPVIKMAEEMMEDIMNCVMKDGKISILKYLTQVADLERTIVASIQKGESTYLRIGSIKDPKSYPDLATSMYQNHLMWNQVFGPIYGEMVDPPYQTLKLSVDLDTPMAMKEWINSHPDREFAGRLTRWFEHSGKTSMTTFHLPIPMVQVYGVPKELLSVIAYDRILGDITRIFSMILESIGYYSMDNKVKRLQSDYY